MRGLVCGLDRDASSSFALVVSPPESTNVCLPPPPSAPLCSTGAARETHHAALRSLIFPPDPIGTAPLHSYLPSLTPSVVDRYRGCVHTWGAKPRYISTTRANQRHVTTTTRAGFEAAKYQDDGYHGHSEGHVRRNLEDACYQGELLGGSYSYARYVVAYALWDAPPGRISQGNIQTTIRKPRPGQILQK
jgi:hypothetical protein